MASTASPSLKLELMATGDQSGTWGDTTNTNLGTLLEQAITGYVAIAKVGTGDYTLSNTDYAANENRNALIEFTGTPGGAFNVVVPLAEKLWVFKNSTNGAMTVKGATGTTITVAVGASAWLFCDGTDVRDALGYYFGSTVTAFSPATNNTQALGTTALQWADLFLGSGGVINFDNGDVTITEGTNTLAFAGASSGYSFDAVVTPAANDGAALGTGAVSWSDLFLASGGVINFNNGNYTLTHSAGVLTANGALSIGTGNALTAGTIELGAATDTTLSRGAAGFIAVEGNRVPSPASQASGDILYRGTTEWERLAKGTAAQVLTMNSGATAPEWAAADVAMPVILLLPAGNEPPSTNYATFNTRNLHPVLNFDTTTAEAAIWTAVLPSSYAGGGLTVDVYWAAATATSGTIGWDVAIERIDASSLDVDADSFAAAQTITAVTVPGTSGQVLKSSVSITSGANMDGLVAGEAFRVRLRRDVANDTATGDAQMVAMVVGET